MTLYVDENYLKNHTLEGETKYSDIIDRIVRVFKLNEKFSEEQLKVMYDGIFVPSSAIMLNSTENILKPNSKRDIFSCYQYEVADDMVAIADAMRNSMLLTASGGGIGVDYSKVSSPNQNKKTNGVIPFIKTNITAIKSVNQADTKKGNCAVYLDLEHDEINEFLEVHIAKGDDELKAKNSSIGVKISDEFMEKVRDDYVSGNHNTKEINLLKKIIKIKYEHGSPYIFFKGNVMRGRSEAYKDLDVNFSNLCTEVLLNTVQGKASVCCLGSIYFDRLMNLEPELQKEYIKLAVEILATIYNTTASVKRSAKTNCELHFDQSIGLGVFGYADYTDRVNKEFDDPEAVKLLTDMFDIANEHGLKIGLKQVTAIAPTERISRLFGASQNIELYNLRKFLQKDDCGNTPMFIKHKKLASDYTARRKIEFTAKVQKHIHQSISLTLFYPEGKPNLLSIMMADVIKAWQLGIKTLYYTKSTSSIVANDQMTSAEYETEIKGSCFISTCGECAS